MFFYFGYGSNMREASLRAKGVVPLSGEPAVLRGWRLTFSVPDFFRTEGGTGNIERRPGDEVHGVLYACRDQDMLALDELEALGVSYHRIQLEVQTYRGRSVEANAYVGIASKLVADQRPSPRYRRLLIRGAEEMKLDAAYVERLRAIEPYEAPDSGPFTFPELPARNFNFAEVASMPLHTSLAGAVFDMSGARPAHQYLQQLLAGRDVTVFFLKRMDSSDGAETLDDFRAGRLTDEQRRFLDRYLHEFAHEYRYAGRIHYDRGEESAQIGIALRRPAPVHRRCRAREVLRTAERINQRMGHENLGFLSERQGFMPLEPPHAELPRSHAAWDQAARDLTHFYRTLTLRRALDQLPVLPADPDHLPDRDLLRAAMVLAMLSHAYQYVEHSPPPAGLPDGLVVPWTEVRKRLGRSQSVLSYIDLIVYNWRLVDPALSDPMRAANLRLLVPTVDTQEERIFYLTQTEILAQTSPIIGAVVRAQEAVLADDPNQLTRELELIMGCMQRVVRESLLNINPNPSSPTHVDPVVWGKTVAPFAVPFQRGIQGPSGTSSPIFSLLDIFLGRRKHKTFLGAEIRQLRRIYPPFWQELLDAVHDVSVGDYVARVARPALSGLLKETVDVYAGKNGFLGRHRMKVYGYLEIAFKVGRSVTIGGFSGMFKDRTWDQVDSELEYSRVERLESFPSSCHQATVRAVRPVHDGAPEGIKSVLLDVVESGVRYQPGDRIGILPDNDDGVIDRTIEALRARGDETIGLTREWREAVRMRVGYEHAMSLPLRDVLRFGRIRPVVPRVAEALHASSQNQTLRQAIIDQTTTRWELWDLLDLLAADGYDVTGLWRRDHSAFDHICRVVPPETFRMYSISSIEEEALGRDGPGDEVTEVAGVGAREVLLTVGRIRYPLTTPGGEALERHGTASSFLAGAAGRTQPIPFFIEHPARFSLPDDPRAPIVMLAGGTGIAPFRGFVLERLMQPDAGEMWLFLATRSREHFYYVDDLMPGLRAGRLHLNVAFSREDSEVEFVPEGDGRLEYRPGRRRYLQDLLVEPDTARRLWDLLRSREEGGQGAYVYVCGRSRIAREVNEAFKQIIARFHPGGDDEDRRRSALGVLARMVGEGRYMQEIFTDARPWDTALRRFHVSDIARHNDDEHGYWLVIDKRVFDVTDFVHLHPGGLRVLLGYSGMDATQGYLRAHAGRSEIDAMLEVYEIGAVAELDFGRVAGVVERASGPQTVSLSALHRAWVHLLYLVVEMQNALRNDFSLQRARTTRAEVEAPRSPFRLDRAVESHERFLRSYIDGIAGPALEELWRVTVGLGGHGGEEAGWMQRALAAVMDGDDAAFVESMTARLYAEVQGLGGGGDSAGDGAGDGAGVAELERACDMVEQADHAFLAAARDLLVAGTEVFERHQARTLERGAEDLIEALRALPRAVGDYFARLHEQLAAAGWKPADDEWTSPRAQRLPEQRLSLLVANRYWTMAEDRSSRVVVLTRSAATVRSIPDLVAHNEEVIARMLPYHAEYGVVVDMRQAAARNDPEFENAMQQLRREAQLRFRRLAVLIESTMGVLQVDRLARNEGGQTFATQSESAALKFARGEG